MKYVFLGGFGGHAKRQRDNMCIRKGMMYAEQGWEQLADNFSERSIFSLVVIVAAVERCRTA